MDNFYQRETFRKLKTSVELDIFKKQDVNKIYKYNDFLVEQIYPLDEKSITNLTNKINYIKDNYLNETNKIYYSIIPDKNYYTDNSHLKPDYDKMKQIMLLVPLLFHQQHLLIFPDIFAPLSQSISYCD